MKREYPNKERNPREMPTRKDPDQTNPIRDPNVPKNPEGPDDDPRYNPHSSKKLYV